MGAAAAAVGAKKAAGAGVNEEVEVWGVAKESVAPGAGPTGAALLVNAVEPVPNENPAKKGGAGRGRGENGDRARRTGEGAGGSWKSVL